MTAPRDPNSEDFSAASTLGEADGHVGVKPLAVGMTVAALSVGSILAYFVIFHQAVSTIETRGSSLAEPASLAVARPKADLALGAKIATEQCSGCHQVSGRLAGPSWRAIATRYDPSAPNQTIETCLPRLVSAVGHPRPGWDGYPPGPELGLDLSERAALAEYILSIGLAGQKRDAQ